MQVEINVAMPEFASSVRTYYDLVHRRFQPNDRPTVTFINGEIYEYPKS